MTSTEGRHRRFVFSAFALLVVCVLLSAFGCGCSGSGGSGGGEQIRVALLQGVPEVRIGGDKRVTIEAHPGGATIYSGTPRGTPVGIQHDGRSLRVRGKRYTVDRLVARIDGGKGIEVNGRPYRGSITVLRNESNLTVVNTLHIEHYVRSVVPGEMLASFPASALQAQAVVARSFGLYHIRRNGHHPFDIPASRIVYKGMAVEDERTTRAVDATRGLVLERRGKLMLPYFCTCCGGHTEYAKNVWPSEQNVTRPVRCPYCKGSPKYAWTASISGTDLGAKLRSIGVADVLSIRVIKRSRADRRITKLRVTHTGGTKDVALNQFRLLVGPDTIRSGFFELKAKDGKFIFTGRGWGHGVGLCQWGAKTLGDKGKSYREILSYYFPGTKLKRMRW